MEKEYKRNYRIEKFVITPQSIHEFEVMENRRMVSDSHVGSIHQALRDGKNPIGILIVNRKKGKMRLIDGNHRVEAVRKFYSYRNEKKIPNIECTLKVYENLTDEEERQIYSDEAKRRNESHEDRLNLYKDSLTFWKLVSDKMDTVNEFPVNVTIYPSKKSVKFRTLLEMLHSSRGGEAKGFTQTNLKKDDLIPFAESCGWDDYNSLKDFFNVFLMSFGELAENNIYCRKSVIIPLYDIYLRNKDKVNQSQMSERFKMTLGKADLLMYTNMGNNKELVQKIRQILVDHMNRGHSVNKFI